MLKQLHKQRLQVDIDKYEFFTTKVKYFVMIITTNGIEIDGGEGGDNTALESAIINEKGAGIPRVRQLLPLIHSKFFKDISATS